MVIMVEKIDQSMRTGLSEEKVLVSMVIHVSVIATDYVHWYSILLFYSFLWRPLKQ